MDCLKPAPEGFQWVLHSIVIFSIPLYSIAIVALLRINSTYFATYKHFLVWHTSINFAAEICNSWLLLPVVHLPHPLLRMTGILTHLEISGLFQFYLINFLISQTAYSILEMFMFRFRAGFYGYQTSHFYLYLRCNVYIFRAILIFAVLFDVVTFSYALDRQLEYRQRLQIENPDAPPELQCFSVVVAAPFSDPVSLFNIAVWILVIVVTFTATSTTTFYLNKHLRDSEHHSPAVLRMQKMLLVSLFVQTAIHGIMLGAPNVLFLYAAFFGANHEVFAHIAFICLTFHGFFSTVAMMIFTRPIKIAVVRMFHCSKFFNFQPIRVVSGYASDTNKI